MTKAVEVASKDSWNAGLYQDNHSFVWKYGADLLELLAPKAGEKILDVGCGTGQLTDQIRKTGAIVSGIDKSAEMIAQAHANFPTIPFDVRDIASSSVADEFLKSAEAEKFDAVFSNAVLHWVKPPEAAVKNIAAALRTGGRFVAEFGGHGNVRQIMRSVAAAIFELQLQFPPDEAARLVNRWYYPSIGEYSSILDANGLEVTYAVLFDRPTKLEAGEDGLRNWIRMFYQNLMERIPMDREAEFFAAVERHARGDLYRGGTWTADYRRLRIVARRV